MKDNDKYMQAYTRWVISETTKEVLLRAQATLMNEAHALGDVSLISAAKAHWFRKGGEVILNYLTTQPTVGARSNAPTDDLEPDYGAEDIVNADLFATK